MKKRFCLLLMVLGIVLSISACGLMSEDEQESGDVFQNNGPVNPDDPDSDFKILELFDGRGSMEDIWDSIDAKEFNSRLSCTVDHYTDDFVTVSKVSAGILRDESQPLAHLLSVDVAGLLGLIRSEDPFYVESPDDIGAFYSKSPGEYDDDFYTFLDKLWEGDQRPGDQYIVAMARNVVRRILDNKSALDILADMQDWVDDIHEDDFDRDFNDLSSLLGKLLIQADYPLWIDTDGHPVNRDAIDPGVDINTGTGNAVQGMNDLVNWLNIMMADPQSRELIYSVIREAGTLFDPDPNSDHAEKIKMLLQNIEDNFTVGGEIYETQPLYKSSPADPTYSDTELGQSVREFMPYLAQLLARSDRAISLVTNENDEEPVYLLRELITALKQTGYDPDKLSIEDSLNLIMKYDLLGRDRTREGAGAFPASMLESLVFLTCATTHFGFADGGNTGETTVASNPITQHGHGAYTEALSLNDSLISMTTFKTLNLLGIYDISFLNNDKNYLSRSNVPFTTSDRSNYKFDVNPDYSILRVMPGTCSGDYGAPDGGNRDGGVVAKNDYKPYNPTGLGETQLAAWTVNWAVRSCFGGEGPYYYADPDAQTVTVNGKDYITYLRPDGRVYALVNKDSDTWEYLYPTDERDGEDPETNVLDDYNGRRQRFNRFKSTWYSDYYMYYRTDGISTIRRTVDNSSGNLETVALHNGDPARRLTYHELIPEDDSTHMRACSSPEEAFFRNYQWVYTEKKMVLIIPQSLDLSILGFGSVFMILEAHGWSGLANMRIFEDNHVWAKKGTTGSSDIPGDYRVELKADMTAIVSLVVNTNSVYDDTLGRGNATPAIVGKNLPAIYRFGFPISPPMARGNGVFDVELGSRDFQVDDEIWQNRNALAPVLISLLQAIEKHRVTYPDYDRNSLKNGILGYGNNVPPLLKPLIYYSKYADSTAPKEVWKLRVQAAPNGQAWYGEPYLRPSTGFAGTTRWDGTDDEWQHYQPAVMKDLINVLIDSDITAPVDEGKRMDGVLPVLTESRAVTNMLKVLMSDANDFNGLYSAMEQISGAVKYTEGQMTAINRAPGATKKIPFPDWMFAVGTGADEYGFYTSFSEVRDEDIILDVGLDRLLGHDRFYNGVNHEGYGLANYVDEQDALNWADFHTDLDMMEDFLYPDSPYSLVESFIDMQNAIFARDSGYSEDQVSGLLYAVGKMFTRYDTQQGQWLIQGETGFADMYNLFKLRIPAIHDLIKDSTGSNYHALLTVNKDMLTEENDCGVYGMIPYLMDAMGTDDGAEQIIGDVHAFLTDPVVSEPHPLWSTLAELISDMAIAVDESKDGQLMENVLKDYGFQQNGNY